MVLPEKYLIIIITITFYIFPGEVCTDDFGIVTEDEIIVFSTEWYGVDCTTRGVGLASMNAATYDPLNKDIYVSDSKKKSIFRIKTTGDTAYKVGIPVVDEQKRTVLALAFDYLESKLYWTTDDGGFFYVRVPYNEIKTPLKVHDMYKSKKQLPKSIAIDVDKKFLYWVNEYNGTQTAKIERSSVDKVRREVLVEDVAGPRDIKLDAEGNKLYWIKWFENFSRNIESMVSRVNGTSYTLVQATVNQKPSVIAVGNRYVYWYDWVSGEFWKVLKNSLPNNAKPTKEYSIALNEQPIALFVMSGSDAQQIRQKR